MSRLSLLLIGSFLCVVLAGCGGGGEAEDGGVVARLGGAGFAAGCEATGELRRKGASGPSVPVKILRRGGLVVIVVRAESAEEARTARALNVHRTSACPVYGPTLAHRVFGRAVVLAAARDGGRTTGAEVTAAMKCAERVPCVLPPPASAKPRPAVKKKKRRARRPPSAYARGFAALSVGAPPLMALQLIAFPDRRQVVAAVSLRRFCAMGIAERQQAVSAFARSVSVTFARFGARGIRVVVSVPSESGRVRALARAIDGRAVLTSRGARAAGCSKRR